MSFSCYQAFVFQIQSNRIIQKKAFNQNDNLIVCTWTNIDESRIIKDPITGLPKLEDKMGYYKAEPIVFNPKNKTISFEFHNPRNGKKELRKAKYKKEKFNIESFDVRTFID